MERISLRIRNQSPKMGLKMGTTSFQPETDYNKLTNKPSIEGHTLVGDSTIQQIGVGELTPQDIDRIVFG